MNVTPPTGNAPLRPDVGAGLLWGLVCAVLGAGVLAWYPIGTRPTQLGVYGPIWNGLLLGIAPALGLWRGYRRVLSQPVEPRGLATQRTIGTRSGLVMLVVFGLFLAVLFALGRDLGICLAASAVVYGSWWLSWETQRRLRAPLALTAWTDRPLDAMRLNLDAVPIGGVLLIAAVAIAATDHAVDGPTLGEIALAIACFTAFSPYLGAVTVRAFRPWTHVLPWLYWPAVFAVLRPSHHLGLDALLLLGGTTFLVATLEIDRSRAMVRRVQTLVDAGDRDRLRARYGPQLRPRSWPSSARAVPDSAALVELGLPVREAPRDGGGQFQIVSRPALKRQLMAVGLGFPVAILTPLFAYPGRTAFLIIEPLLYLVFGLAGWALILRVPRMGARLVGDSVVVRRRGGDWSVARSSARFRLRSAGPVHWLEVSDGNGSPVRVPTSSFLGSGRRALHWREPLARPTRGWTLLGWSGEPARLNPAIAELPEHGAHD